MLSVFTLDAQTMTLTEALASFAGWKVQWVVWGLGRPLDEEFLFMGEQSMLIPSADLSTSFVRE